MDEPSEDLLQEIHGRIDKLEDDHDLNVFYVVESGSRAWGFASHNSDWDVRFLYAHPIKFYARPLQETHPIEKKGTITMKIVCREDGTKIWVPREQILKENRRDELDIVGWDLKKVMDLIRKSNPPLLEWLDSPIVYQKIESVVDILREVSRSYYSPKASMYHYLHMAEGNFRQYLGGGRTEVELKKYLYVIRPILACLWIERTQEVAPMPMDKLLEAAKSRVPCHEAIVDLIKIKMGGDELGRGPVVESISNFLIHEIERLHELLAGSKIKATYKEPAQLNEAFGKIMKILYKEEGNEQS